MIKKVTKAESKNLGRDHIWFPEVGETVTIVVPKPKKVPGMRVQPNDHGKITDIDGEYISVKYGKPARTGEFYKSELKLVQPNVNKGIGKKK